MLKTSSKHLVEVGDWDDLVEKTYGKPYNFQQQRGARDRGVYSLTVPYGEQFADEYPDSIPEDHNSSEMGVSFASWLARDPKEWHGEPHEARYINMFWQCNFYPDIQMVANDLHAKGLLPAGDYAINIDW